MAEEIGQRLELYRAKQPYRERVGGVRASRP
jgi:hypothetical protein